VSVFPTLLSSSFASIASLKGVYGPIMGNITSSSKFGIWTAFPLLVSALAFHYRRLAFDSQNLQCSILSASLPGRVSYPASSAYAASTTSYWSTFESSIKPACIVTPRNTDDVAVTIKVLTWLPLSDACKLAIRGGGHTPWAGSANIEGGITLDLSSMKTITVNQDRSVVAVGAGSLWGEVYRKTDELGIAVIGGRGSSIGVGGLTLGGMYKPVIGNVVTL
jgi:hypothetical protein